MPRVEHGPALGEGSLFTPGLDDALGKPDRNPPAGLHGRAWWVLSLQLLLHVLHEALCMLGVIQLQAARQTLLPSSAQAGVISYR